VYFQDRKSGQSSSSRKKSPSTTNTSPRRTAPLVGLQRLVRHEAIVVSATSRA
jgi:hypothetical protein